MEAAVANKLTEAQRRRLELAPDEWGKVPLFGDNRSFQPLLQAGMIEERRIDVTPADWEPSPVRQVRHEWRITPAGRAKLAEER